MERGKLDGNVYTGADSGNAMDSGDHEPGLTALGLDTETRIGGSIHGIHSILPFSLSQQHRLDPVEDVSCGDDSQRTQEHKDAPPCAEGSGRGPPS